MTRQQTAPVGQNEVLLEVRNLVKHFPIRQGIIFSKQVGAVQAVDDISFTVRKGETLGLVGESGCGKTTTGRLILRLIEPTSGDIIFDGKNIPQLPKDEMRELRKEMQIIFQDPYGSLNPRMTVGDIIGEPLHIHKLARGAEREKRVRELLEVVGLSAFHAQAQVINLLQDLQKEFDLTYIFIAHDLAVVKHISDRVAVMYLGKIVELTDKNELYRNPKHPYTQALLSAIPEADPTIKKERILLKGDVPSPINPPKGCRFHTRCPKVMDICKVEEPEFVDSGNGHFVACHLVPAAEEKGA